MLIKSAEGILFSLGVLLISLIALYGVASLIVKFSPQPVGGWVSQIVAKSAPSGWNISK